MIDFINFSNDYSEFSEENISSAELNYADYSTYITEHNELSFPGEYLSFFEKDARYIVSMLDENDQKSTDDSYTVVEHNENSLVLKNTLETEYGTVYRYIMLNLKISIMEEMTEVSSECECLINGLYEMDKIILSSDKKELTFILKTRNSLQKVMKVRKF
ncbi:hypothetical protein Wcon_01943 [Wolbachia endosymbiont of Cylisticus convexus]|uniref:hypothetical protein n=1 Tax=Wolbachia endosymbiont of Cylisticus convexus TaxID=118728 RepID=UPI000DF67A76|nr:hypothetical protein [Wolbachia endosymbiont of Cylisticus convexus]RDD34020.1 hypothetical protein Wcon_01943 [Wolbachia endosymbiont of Cylisticus convexus]